MVSALVNTNEGVTTVEMDFKKMGIISLVSMCSCWLIYKNFIVRI